MNSTNTTMVGSRLREERERLKLSVSEFAKGTGVSDRSQRNYESAQRVPDAEYLIKADSMGADVDYILTGKKSEWKTLAASVEDECELLNKVIGLLTAKTMANGGPWDSDRFAKTLTFLYRNGRFGGPVSDAVVDELLGITKR